MDQDEKTAQDRKRRTPARHVDARQYEVLVSFDGLDKGDRFGMDADGQGWAQQHVENGYLRDVTEPVEASDERSDAGQS